MVWINRPSDCWSKSNDLVYSVSTWSLIQKLDAQMSEWCCRGDLNSRPLPYQGSALPLSYGSFWWNHLMMSAKFRAFCHTELLLSSLKRILLKLNRFDWQDFLFQRGKYRSAIQVYRARILTKLKQKGCQSMREKERNSNMSKYCGHLNQRTFEQTEAVCEKCVY